MKLADWITIVTVGIPALASAIVSVVTAIRTNAVSAKVTAVHQEVRPPSNGTTAGAYTEAGSNAQVATLHLVADALKVKVPPLAAEVQQVTPPPRPDEPPMP